MTLLSERKMFVNDRGNTVEPSFVMFSNRYGWDFTQCKLGWRQFDTDQDAHYFGFWFHPGKRQTVTYTEGDVNLVTCPDWDHFVEEIKDADRFYGGQPPMAVSGDGMDLNMKLTNPVVYYDENARLDYSLPKPEREDPIDLDYVLSVFMGLYKEKEPA